MKFKYNTTVSNHDVDLSGIARASCVMRYMQEAAALQLDSAHPNAAEMRAELGFAFILSRANMSVYMPLRLYDELEVETWPVEGKGAVYTRCATIRCNGTLAAEMTTRWALVELETHRLVRHSEFSLPFDTHEPLELEAVRTVIPKDAQMNLIGERTVTYSQTDLNGHMNNTCYPDFFCDFLNMKDEMVVRFCISYLNEALLGETLKVYSIDGESDSKLFRTVREDGNVNAEVEIVLDRV